MVIVVKASARKHGKSNQIVDELSQKLGEEVVVYDLNTLKLKGCTGCRLCKTSDNLCVVNDGFKEFWTDLQKANHVIYGSPNYMGTINGQLKMVYDRHYCLSDIGGQPKVTGLKSCVLVMAQGFTDEGYYEETYKSLGKVLAKQLDTDVKLLVYGGEETIGDGAAIHGQIDALVKSFKGD